MSIQPRSRRLRSSNLNDVFVVDDEDAPPLKGETISADDSWVTVWGKLRSAGWVWRKGNNLYDYLYLKPGITSIRNKRLGVDYFVDEDHVKKYAMTKYGWSDKPVNASDDDSIDMSTTSCSGNETVNNTIVTKTPIDKHTIQSAITKQDINIEENDAESIETKQSRGTGQIEKKETLEIQSRSLVTVVKGSKRKPGLITFENKGDYRIGRNVAFLLTSKEGREIKNYFGGNIPENAIESVQKNGKSKNYLVGVIDKKSNVKGRKDHYTVAWCYSCDILHSIDLQIEVIDKGISQFLSMKKRDSSITENRNIEDEYNQVFSTDFIEKVLHKCDNVDNEGERIESDDCLSDDDGFEIDDIDINHHVNAIENITNNLNKFRLKFTNDISMTPLSDDHNVEGKSERINGLKWEMNGTLNAPPGLSYRQKTKMKFIDGSKCGENLFRTELESLLAFLPLKFWVFHLNECNKYVDQFLMTNGNGNKKYAGSNWKPITINELMTFYAILFQMVCRPFPGKRYEECWDHIDGWFTNCKHMTKTRFKQIRASLHWCDNPHSTSRIDTLYKIRPMISILEMTIGQYLHVGRETALDETTIGLYHAYAKALTFDNPNKPRGKHHCKLFVLCENDICLLLLTSLTQDLVLL